MSDSLMPFQPAIDGHEHLAVLEVDSSIIAPGTCVLLDTAHVGKTEIDVSDVLILDQLEDTGNGHENLGLGVVVQ